MKKLFTLLLLGGMLLGAQSAWADDPEYNVAHNKVLNTADGHSWSTTADPMTKDGDEYSITFSNVGTDRVEFKITHYNSWDGAIGPNADGYTYKNTSSDLTLSEYSSNISFVLPVASDVTIHFNPTSKKIYASTPTLHTVTLYVEGLSNPYLHAWSGYNYFNGDSWPGAQNGSLVGDKDQFSLSIPHNFPLSIIFNNNNDKQTTDIHIGAVTSNIEKTFYVSSSDYSFNFIGGSFNNNENNYSFNQNSCVIIPLAASTEYDVRFGHCYNNGSDQWQWAGSGAAKMTVGGALDLYSDNSTQYKLQSNSAGDYLFVYKSWSGVTVSLDVSYPGASYSRTMADEAWGTICLPYAVSTANVSVANMDFYSILGVDSKAAPTKLYLKEETELVAGKPYIFQATAADPSVTYGTTAAMVGSENGLVGTYVATSIDGSNDADKLYVITAAGEVQRAAASCNVGANKAYIKFNDVPEGNSFAPGVRVIEMNMGANNATDISSIEANEVAHKFIENGKLFIQKNGVVYDMTGRVVR